ncbi:MAG: acyl--CoA ligase [Proteobacteria bacterium]|nr:acyl--CoA ligase [Burkholderiales bacterium]
MFAEGSAEHGAGDRIALIDLNDWARPREYTHRQCDALADAFARGLIRSGGERGDAIAIVSANRAEFLIAFLGILRAGMVAVPINHKLARATISFIFADAAVRHVVCDAHHRDLVPPQLPVTDLDAGDERGLGALLDHGAFEPVRPRPGEVAMVLYTSGSTGRPKGVPLTHDGHLWALRARTRRGGPFHEHRLLVAAPLYHMNGLCTSLFTLGVGASMVLLPEFDARHYLESIERFRCTWLTGVPPMFAMCLQHRDLMASVDRRSVRTVRMGSAPISPRLWEDVQTAFADALVMNSYGTTEAGPVVCAPRPDLPLPTLSIGWAVEDVELRLVDAEGNDADEGVLWQRTPANMTGYLNLPDRTREVLTPDGWYISGDIFRRDHSGAYFFIGRADDMFVCGGENIFPGAVEALLEQHPQIDQACVVPVPDEVKGEKPFAFVVRAAGSTLDEPAVKRFALDHAPAYQHPRRIAFLDALPLAGPNKVDRKTLKVRAAAIVAASTGSNG